MQVVLVMFRGDGERRSFSIARDVTIIGRREDCDFRIPLGEISRKHCRIIKDGDTLRIEDLGSSNGTYVSGERIQEAELHPGDTLQMGSVVFVVQIDGTPEEDEMVPITAGGKSTVAPGTAEHLSPTDQNDAADANPDEFDPMAILAGPGAEDSGQHDLIADSQLGEDIMIDLGNDKND
jgi:pSer/pThr/pTyr-binding forkhead associated (FHA) protein